MNPGDEALIVAGFELAAARCEDLTPAVYARLFAGHPDMQPLFFADRDGQVRGEMLSRVIEAILDFAGPRQYAATMIQCEVITHAGYDVPPDVFAVFFGVVRDSLRQVVGGDWSAEIDGAWDRLLAGLDYYVTHPDQAETQAAAG